VASLLFVGKSIIPNCPRWIIQWFVVIKQRRAQKTIVCSVFIGTNSRKFGFQFHRHSLWDKRVAQITQCFLVFSGPNRSWAGNKNFYMLEQEPGIWVPPPQPCSKSKQQIHLGLINSSFFCFLRKRGINLIADYKKSEFMLNLCGVVNLLFHQWILLWISYILGQVYTKECEH